MFKMWLIVVRGISPPSPFQMEYFVRAWSGLVSNIREVMEKEAFFMKILVSSRGVSK